MMIAFVRNIFSTQSHPFLFSKLPKKYLQLKSALPCDHVAPSAKAFRLRLGSENRPSTAQHNNSTATHHQHTIDITITNNTNIILNDATQQLIDSTTQQLNDTTSKIERRWVAVELLKRSNCATTKGNDDRQQRRRQRRQRQTATTTTATTNNKRQRRRRRQLWSPRGACIKLGA